MPTTLILLGLLALQAAGADRIDLRVDTSAAEAVLAIADRHAAGEAVSDDDWRRLFETEPYRRLKTRERGIGRPFTDEDFKAFVLSDGLAARRAALGRTLEAWRARDLGPSARRVLDYLPTAARIRAAVYPMIKPRTNSFVFDLRGDPAIFLHLDPAQSAEKFENTVAHELHHIGFASVPSGGGDADRPQPVRAATTWMGAFGEGFAMLAAAGGPDVHPHAVSPDAERARWDLDAAAFNAHAAELEAFFLQVIAGAMPEEEIRKRALTFFGDAQGPWYTVGYRMAVIVERRFGRDVLIACMADPPTLLARYNEAAAELNARGSERLALWSPKLLAAIGAK